MDRRIVGLVVGAAVAIAGGTTLAAEWDEALRANGWKQVPLEELLKNRPADVTLKGHGAHKGRITYIDPSGLKMYFTMRNGAFRDTGTREYKPNEVCNKWSRINSGVPYCFPTDRTVWVKGELTAVYKISGEEVYIYARHPGNPENLGN